MEPYKNDFSFGTEFTARDGALYPVDTLCVEEAAVLLLPDDCGPDTLHDELEAARQAHWPEYELVSGYSGQHGYSGPVMHVSEYFGGGMVADCIADNGEHVYVMAWIDSIPHYWDDCPDESGECLECIESTPVGWILLKRERDEYDTIEGE